MLCCDGVFVSFYPVPVIVCQSVEDITIYVIPSTCKFYCLFFFGITFWFVFENRTKKKNTKRDKTNQKFQKKGLEKRLKNYENGPVRDIRIILILLDLTKIRITSPKKRQAGLCSFAHQKVRRNNKSNENIFLNC